MILVLVEVEKSLRSAAGSKLKKKFYLYLIMILGMGTAMAAEPHAAVNAVRAHPVTTPACPGSNSKDPFAMNMRFKTGPRRGECINLDEFRPIHILSEEEAAQYAQKANLTPPIPGEIWVANIRHKNKFWVAKISPDSVEDILFEVERFDYGGKILAGLNKRFWYAAHAEVRFKFKKDKKVILVPQFIDDEEPVQPLADLVFSSEAIRHKGEPFNPIKGNRDSYGLAKRVLSLDQVVNDSIIKLGHEIAQYPIKLSGDKYTQEVKRQNYLASALTRSDRDWQSYHQGKPVMYNTREENCISDALDIFDDITRYSHFSDWEKENPEFLPRHILNNLYERGLIFSTHRRQYPTLNQEVGITFRQ